MFHKIVHFIDKKHFGDQVLIYKGDIKNQNIYFVIIKDREELVYFFVDSSLEKEYPMNAYINSLGINIDLKNIPQHLDIVFDVDLSHYGYSKCSSFLVKLIHDSI